jgi:diguanylate cyclase (GGDEF)-like protein/PAS domain S-box-containing protein
MKTALITLIYVACAKIGFLAAFVHGSVSAVWLPTGVALAALLLSHYRLWPGIALGAFLANALTPAPLWVTLGIAVGNTLEALVGAWLLRRYSDFDQRLQRTHDVVVLVLGGALLSTLISASIGGSMLCLGGAASWADFSKLWWVWWLGDALGVLTVTPMILVFAPPRPASMESGRVGAGLVLCVLTAMIALPVFFGWFDVGGAGRIWSYAVFPFVIAAAMRYGQSVTTASIFLVAGIAIFGTSQGYGPFAEAALSESLLQLQLFIATMSVTALLLAAAMTEQRQHREALRFHRDHLQELVTEKTAHLTASMAALEAANQRLREECSINAALVRAQSEIGDGLAIIENSRLRFVNEALCHITGFPADELLSKPSIEALFVSEERDVLLQSYEHLVTGVSTARICESRVLHRDGRGIDVMVGMAAVESKGKRIVILEFRDITDLKRQKIHLEHMATHDALTGLPNRSLLVDRFQQAIASAKRYQHIVAILFIDLDRFKSVNDSFGHAFGDETLKAFAGRLLSLLRESDTAGRLGGDEFAILLGDQPGRDNFLQALHRIVNALAEPLTVGDRKLVVTGSIGCALYPQDGVDAETLLRSADAAMYRGKELGRGGLQFVTPELQHQLNERVAFESSLRQALDREEFELYYQPQVDLTSGSIVGAEALLRWRHPTRGLVEPGQFIHVAEELDLIVPIGQWVLTRACLQNKAWQDAGLPSIPIAVNLSTKQCLQNDIDTVVSGVLRRTALAPQYLELELTESASMADPENTIPLIRRLKEMGVTFAIDDFGTGYSNMACLKGFPADKLKLDVSFVREITTEPESLAISNAVLTMAQCLQLKVVAEGVETQGQLALLAAYGCDQMQGFFFSRPLPADGIAALLREGRTLALDDMDRRQTSALLVLDDDADMLELLQYDLSAENYHLLFASRAAEAFEMLAQHEVAVVLSDQHMPDITGVEFLEKVSKMYPDTVRMIFSGYEDFEAAQAVINRGLAWKFLGKTWNRAELRTIVRGAFDRYQKTLNAKPSLQFPGGDKKISIGASRRRHARRPPKGNDGKDWLQ